MKRIIAAIVLASLLLMITGCKKNDTENTLSTTGSDVTVDNTAQEPEKTVMPIKQIPMVSVAMPLIAHSAVAKDNNAIFKNLYQNMVLITQDPEVADKIIIDYLNKTDMSSTANTMQAQAEKAYNEKSDQAPWSPYLLQTTYTPMRIDSGILSLLGANVSYAGSAHADLIGNSITYDLTTGGQLSLADIFTKSANAKYICDLVLDALSSENRLFIDYEATVRDRFDENFIEDTDWYFSNNGLCFYFSPYEIASYANGIITAEIPYNKLTGVMQDKFFPSERESAQGTVLVSEFESDSLAKFSQFSEVVLEEGTDKILLHSENGVYDVRIESGSWSADGLTYTAEHTVFACYALTPGDAIMVDSHFTQTRPTLRLSYTTGEQTVRYYIAVNNGTPVLTPA